MTIGIYKITNKKTGQMYVGKSINIEKRFKEHINGNNIPNSRIDNTIQKYGKDYFEFKIIEKFDENTPFLDDVLNDREQYYIATYNTFQNDFHYNLTIGGDGVSSGENHPMYGKKHSEESKKKMSENHWDNSGENHPFYGKKHSEESKKKMSKSLTGRRLLKETKKKMSENHADVSGKNNPGWKNYARITKDGKNSNNKQVYSIRYQGKKIKQSISINKLKKWFAENYPCKELRCDIES